MRNANQTVGTFVLGYIDGNFIMSQGLILIGISAVLISSTTSLISYFFRTISLLYLKFSKNG